MKRLDTFLLILGIVLALFSTAIYFVTSGYTCPTDAFCLDSSSTNESITYLDITNITDNTTAEPETYIMAVTS